MLLGIESISVRLVALKEEPDVQESWNPTAKPTAVD